MSVDVIMGESNESRRLDQLIGTADFSIWCSTLSRNRFDRERSYQGTGRGSSRYF